MMSCASHSRHRRGVGIVPNVGLVQAQTRNFRGTLHFASHAGHSIFMLLPLPAPTFEGYDLRAMSQEG